MEERDVMKITPKQYAALLYETTKSTKGAELTRHAKEFIQLLARNRAMAMIPRIERAYQDYYNRQEKVLDVTVTTAREVSKNIVHKIEQNVAQTFRSEVRSKDLSYEIREARSKDLSYEIRENIDPDVLGGARIRVGDYMLDDTLKARIMKLKQSLYAR